MNVLRDLEPLVRKIAGSAHRKMPASVDVQDVQQEARIAAWQAAESFDGRGTIDGYVAQRARQRIIDWQRGETPNGRSTRPVEFVSVDSMTVDELIQRSPPGPDRILAGKRALQAVEQSGVDVSLLIAIHADEIGGLRRLSQARGLKGDSLSWYTRRYPAILRNIRDAHLMCGMRVKP